MKKILLAMVLVAAGTSLCLAQPEKKPAAPTTVPMQDKKVAVGKVDAVSMADPAKGTKSEITVVNEGGKKTTILVTGTTTIYDAMSSAITLDKVQKDERVKVKYITTKEGLEEAVSIRIMK